MSMNITLNHVTINVTDIKKSCHFYESILGFNKIEVVNMGDHEITYYEIPGGSVRLELIDYFGSNRNITTRADDGGIFRHAAFWTDNLDDLAGKIESAGFEITLPVTDVPNLGVKIILIKDPSGVELEFCERLNG